MRTALTALDHYLKNVKQSSYASLVYEKAYAPNVSRNSDGTIDPPPLVVEGVTGALEPALPMIISIQGSNNSRLEFTLLINPANMNHNKTATVNPAYTRKGWVTQLWGPNQDLITSTGTTAAFMVSGTGLTSVDRRMSLGMHNFLALLYTYRNNGCELIDPTDKNSLLNRVTSLVHGVEVSYDGQTFMGHFNNFTIDENAEKPFLFDYNFDFVVSSLSKNYNEVRGHFSEIGIPPSSYKPGGPKLLSQTKKRGTTQVRSTLVPRTQANPAAAETTPSQPASPPAVLNPKSNKEFVDQVYAAAKLDEARTGVPAAITTAQAILESGYGKHLPTDLDSGQVSNNVFGIKASSGPGTAGSVNSWTREVKNGKSERVIQPFRAYNNVEESINDHSAFLKRNSRYDSLFTSTDPNQWADGLQAAGYATDPHYAESLKAVMKTWNLE